MVGGGGHDHQQVSADKQEVVWLMQSIKQMHNRGLILIDLYQKEPKKMIAEGYYLYVF